MKIPRMSLDLVRLNSTFFRYFIVSLSVFLVLGGFFARFFWLKYIPFAYYHDEMDYVLTGEAVARFGTNISGQWSPWKLVPELTTNVTGELPALFQAITQRIFGYGANYGHYTSAIFGILNAGLVGYIAWKIWRDRRIAFFSALCLLITPWNIHISRMAYEAPISLFFQLLLVLSLFELIFKQPKKLQIKHAIFWGIVGAVAVFFAYYTYHAAKFIVPSLLVGSLIYAVISIRTRWTIIPMAILLVFVSGLLLRTIGQSENGLLRARDTEMIYSSTFLKPLIDKQRLDSLEIPGTSLFLNKATVFVFEAIKRYAGVFDITRLGINGYENSFQFSLAVNGFFFISVMAMMAFGIFRGLKTVDDGMKYLIFMMVISPVASVINAGYQSIFRCALTYTLLLMFAGYGFAKLSYEKHWKAKVLLLGLLVCACVELAAFTHQYLNRYGVISAENHYYHKKLLAGYITRIPKDQQVIVIGEQAYMNARALVSYGSLLPSLTADERKGLGTANLDTYIVGNVRFTQTCEGINVGTNVTYVVDGSMTKGCGYARDVAAQATRSGQKIPDGVDLPAISSQVGSGTYYNMINDAICKDMALPHFVRARKIQDFDPVNLSNEEYCKTWVKSEPIGI